jgi:hypothetical protein
MCIYSTKPGGPSAGPVVILDALADVQAATAEFAAEDKIYTVQQKHAKATVPGADQASAYDGLIFARHGRFLINVQGLKTTAAAALAGQALSGLH